MKKTTHQPTMTKIIDCPQNLRRVTTNDQIILKIEKKHKGTLLEVKQQDFIS